MNAEELLEKYASGIRDFTGIHLGEASLIGANLTDIMLQGANLNVANLSSANLSRSNLSDAKLNVSRLSGANLSGANLSRASLNVANLIRSILVDANMPDVSMIRAELVRSDLSRANLRRANMSESDLREVRLRSTDLTGAILTRVDLRNSVLTGATLEGADLHAANLGRADLNGALLRNVELRHASLNRASLNGANLRGANLRWVDLSGADLREADLTDAKLSGANLMGANLTGADLVNTSLVHADLSQANLMHCNCTDSDLTGAILTGSKLYGSSRYNLVTKDLICDWVDLSPNGDQGQRHTLNSIDEIHQFFNHTPPQVHIVVDAMLTPAANLALAQFYAELSRLLPNPYRPPSLVVGNRKTSIQFRTHRDEELFALAYAATLPFKDARSIQKNLALMLRMGQSYQPDVSSAAGLNLEMLNLHLMQTSKQLHSAAITPVTDNDHFFKRPIQLQLTNSKNYSLEIYHNPRFGIRSSMSSDGLFPVQPRQDFVPSLEAVLEFISSFRAEQVN